MHTQLEKIIALSLIHFFPYDYDKAIITTIIVIIIIR